MLVDAHIHTSGISTCSRVSPEELAKVCHEDQLDAIVLTNHCKSYYIDGTTYRDWCKKYVEEYQKTKEACAAFGIKVIFGLEVTPEYPGDSDFLYYGLTEDAFLHSPQLFDLKQKELFEFAVANNALLYNAHPYRGGTVPQDPNYLHGVEINCHPLYGTNERYRVTAFAKEHNLKLSCGSDFHGDTYKAHCGMIVPDTITDTVSFAEFLRQPGQCELVIHDIGGEEKI